MNKLPPIDELELSIEEEGNQRFIAAWYENKFYRVRIPLHVWNEKDQDRKEFLLRPYIREMMIKIRYSKFKAA